MSRLLFSYLTQVYETHSELKSNVGYGEISEWYYENRAELVYGVFDKLKEVTIAEMAVWIDEFYSHGEYAISIFFCISGLVFSNLYLQENQKNTFRNFFVKRFARLYPLHILTLFLIIALQLIFLNIFGSFQFTVGFYQ